MPEEKLWKCEFCGNRAHGAFVLTMRVFGRDHKKVKALCASCGFSATDKRRMVEDKKTGDVYFMRFITKCKLAFSFTTDAVKPEPHVFGSDVDPRFMEALDDIKKQRDAKRRNRVKFTPRFVSDPDFAQTLDDWRE